jgi:hypothetical protein
MERNFLSCKSDSFDLSVFYFASCVSAGVQSLVMLGTDLKQAKIQGCGKKMITQRLYCLILQNPRGGVFEKSQQALFIFHPSQFFCSAYIFQLPLGKKETS